MCRLDLPEIRIGCVPEKMHEELKNISKNMGLNMGSMLKPVIRKWMDEQPERLKKPPLDY